MQYSSIRFKELFIIMTLIAFSAGLVQAAEVTLQWNPSTDTTVTGYKINYGTAPATYQTSINVGNQTTYTVTGLGSGTFYFAVSAYNAAGIQSSFTNEVSKALASTPPSSGSLAHSGTMTTNSQNFAADHSVEHLWDGCTGDTSTCTSGNTGFSSFWVEFDLGQQYNLTSARLFGDAGGSWTSQSWNLSYRTTSTASWQSAFSGANAFVSDWTTQPLTIAARYVRVEVLGNSSTNAIQARELEIYGTLSGPSPSPLPAPLNVTVK